MKVRVQRKLIQFAQRRARIRKPDWSATACSIKMFNADVARARARMLPAMDDLAKSFLAIHVENITGYRPVAAPNIKFTFAPLMPYQETMLNELLPREVVFMRASSVGKTTSIDEFRRSIQRKLALLDQYFVKPLVSRYTTQMLFEIYFKPSTQLLLTYTPKEPNEQ